MILGLIAFVFSTVVAAQDIADIPTETRITPASSDFSLFESLDSSNNAASASSNGRNPQNNRNTRATQAQPTFTLIGTSRIGSNRKAILRHMSGETVQVPLTDGISNVPGHELYAVVNHGAGQLALRYPAAVPCGDFPEQGVSCDSNTNISSLSITTAKAIAVSQPAPVIAEEALESDINGVNAQSVQTESVRNPFAAIRDRGRAGSAQAAPTSQFQARRIAPEDVPPGKRVVSTPFGDRLVDI